MVLRQWPQTYGRQWDSGQGQALHNGWTASNSWELSAQCLGILLSPSPPVLLVLRLQACIPQIFPGALSLHAFSSDAWESSKLFHLGHTQSWLADRVSTERACTLSNLTLVPQKAWGNPLGAPWLRDINNTVLSTLKDPTNTEWLKPKWLPNLPSLRVPPQAVSPNSNAKGSVIRIPFQHPWPPVSQVGSRILSMFLTSGLIHEF